MVRVLANDISDNGYLYALLSSEFGINLLKREASGSSIPHLEENRIKKIRIPWPSSSERKRIGEKVWESLDLRDKSNDSEIQAISLTEKAIKEGGR
jgi:type I restriction enzyme S subunit